MSTDFELPELGEGVEQGTVVKLLVSEGDTIEAEQPVMEVEVEKATVELPSPYAGKVNKLHVAEGDTVEVGAKLMTIAEADGAEAAAPAKKEPAPKEPAPKEPAREAKGEAAKPEPEAPAPRVAVAERKAEERPAAAARQDGGDGLPAPAGPAVRRLARLLGVGLERIPGSGQRGRITAEDVHAFVRGLAPGNGTGAAAAPALPDFAQWGPVEARPLTPVRRRIAEAMARSWSLIPHVTHHDLADVTDLEAGRRAFRKRRPDGPKVTMTVLIAKACAIALRAHPELNSSLDLAAGRQILKDHYHLGVAVDTEYGLLVPVLHDVDKKSVLALSDELDDLARRTRERQVKPEELRGATFTISNLGGIGGTAFTPIVNWPQVAILGVSRSREEYQVTPSGPRPRLQMPLSLSYDHRAVDGALAARFTRRVAELLSSPAELLFEV